MNRTEPYFVPDKQREFRLYVIWKSLDHTMDKNLFEKLGVTDELILEIADIKTQKDIQIFEAKIFRCTPIPCCRISNSHKRNPGHDQIL